MRPPGDLRSILTKVAAETPEGYLHAGDVPRPLRAQALELTRDLARTTSVLIPTRDRVAVLGAAIESALSQSMPAGELVVVDDASTDDTIPMLHRTFGRAIERGDLVIRSSGGRGSGAARNVGLAAARHPHIAYLDSDNTWHPDHLLWTLGVGLHPGDCDLAYSAFRITDHDTGEVHVWSRPFELGALFRLNYIDTSSLVHLASAPTRWGGWDTGLSRLLDWDFALRMVAGRDAVHVPVLTAELNLAAALRNITNCESNEENFARIDAKYPVQRVLVRESTVHHEQYTAMGRTVPPPEGPAAGSRLVLVVDDEEDERTARADLVAAGLPPEFVAGVETIGSSAVTTHRPASPHTRYWWPTATGARPHPVLLRHALVTALADATDVVTTAPVPGRNGTFLTRAAFEQLDRRGEGAALSAEVVRLPWLAGPAPDADHGAPLLLGALGDAPGDPVPAAGDPQRLRALPSWSDAAGVAPAPGPRDRPVVFVYGVHAHVGGAERIAIELIKQLSHRYRFVYVVTGTSPARVTLHQAIEDAGAVLVDVAHRAAAADQLTALAAIKEVFGTDLVLLTNGCPWLLANGVEFRTVFADVPIVAQHYYDERAGWIDGHVEGAADLFDHFIAVNHGILDRLTGEFDLPADRTTLIHHPVDRDRIERGGLTDPRTTLTALGIPADQVVITQIGRLVDQKQPLGFLELARRWRQRPDHHFVLVGQGPLQAACEQFIAAHRLDNVRMLPHLDEVPAFLRACDLLVLSSIYEGLPLVALEALGVGTPVLATPTGDLPWLFDHFGGGQVVGDGDPRALLTVDLDAVRMRWAGGDPADRATFLDHFCGTAVAARYDAVFSRLLDRPTAG